MKLSRAPAILCALGQACVSGGAAASARARAGDKGEHKVVRHSKKELVVCW